MPAVQVKDCRTAEDVIANYRAIKAKMAALKPYQPPVEIKPEPVAIPIVEREPEPEPIPVVVVAPPRTDAEPAVPTLATIIQCVCRRYRVSAIDIKSARRTAAVVLPRQIVFYFGRSLTLLSLPQIGRLCGGKDHTSVLHGVRKIARLAQLDADLAQELKDLEAEIAAITNGVVAQ
jgi:hypothetical protein